MKYTRLIIGIAAILATLWVIIGEQMTAASANATVNAPVVTLRAPVAGTLEMQGHALGARLGQNELLATVNDPLADSVRLYDLQLEADTAGAAYARLEADIEQKKKARADLEARAERFHAARIEEIEARLKEARERVALLEASDESTGSAAASLADGVTVEDSRRPGEPVTRALALSHARERVETLEIELATAREGVYLGDGYNDAPYAGQRMAQIDDELDSLNAALTETDAQRAAIERRMTRARQRLGRQSRAELRTPAEGMLFWETLQADAVTVQRGDPILRLVDCSRSMITLSVTERTFNSLRVGQDASFRFTGQSHLYPATVGRLAGSGARTIYANLAVAPSAKHLERYDVTLLVPSLNADPEIGCAVGRTGRAFFDGRPLDIFRGWFD
ncbi:Curdlan synthesis protein [Salipiger sp. CCB-MM3]|uniref:HlyD family efflux transporter periplasmic adaptor subunit n=1 Tax=Salipiger sp. CCB-MM3 TaxID=1792508 RepID=UPI00080A9E26|nr:HlyD family efflux transporter periplasmic adaptor subunit [Salipiger sp. CCB-MM3]ANT59487.1 Curdlan synthesis protein [Salipiger sp. CCB-MM3]